MIKRLILITLLTMQTFVFQLYADSIYKIVIPDCDTTGISLSKGKALSDAVHTQFQKSGKFIIIERKNLTKILKEIELAQSGLTKNKNLPKLGMLSGADGFLFCRLTRASGISLVDKEEKFSLKFDLEPVSKLACT